MSTLPQMGTSKTQDISSIQIQEKGIAKLLSKLNINKASGICVFVGAEKCTI
jgi:hypothetical protein